MNHGIKKENACMIDVYEVDVHEYVDKKHGYTHKRVCPLMSSISSGKYTNQEGEERDIMNVGIMYCAKNRCALWKKSETYDKEFDIQDEPGYCGLVEGGEIQWDKFYRKKKDVE